MRRRLLARLLFEDCSALSLGLRRRFRLALRPLLYDGLEPLLVERGLENDDEPMDVDDDFRFVATTTTGVKGAPPNEDFLLGLIPCCDWGFPCHHRRRERRS